MSTLGQRLKECRKESGLSQKEVCKRVGIKQGSLSELENGLYLTSTFTPRLAALYGVESIWLADGAGTKYRKTDNVVLVPASNPLASLIIPRHPDDPLPDGMVQIAEYTVSFSAGNGRTAHFELDEESEPATYRLSWLQKERLRVDHLKRFKVRGDSMEPWVCDGDTVLVNLAENDITRLLDNRVYAIRYQDELRIKLLQRRLDGSLVLQSYNSRKYPDEIVAPPDVEAHINLIGRVRDRSGSGGC